MRAEFLRTEGDDVVASVWWDGRGVVFADVDATAREAVERIFRSTPVVVDDQSYRSLGAHGEAVIQPGNAEWFRAAAYQRAGAEGLKARVIPEVVGQGGWDPAAAYRTFREDVGRLLERGIRRPDRVHQPGERVGTERPENGARPGAPDPSPDVR